MAAAFGIRVERLSPQVACIAVTGELDLQRAYTFDCELQAIEQLGAEQIVLDLTETTFVDSAGLGRIVAAKRRAQRDGRRLVIVRGNATVQRVFALTALADQFEMVSSVEAALN